MQLNAKILQNNDKLVENTPKIYSGIIIESSEIILNCFKSQIQQYL
ncbi:14927_t:CDS:2 [Funneliformis mosseae]|uniref:14927_t:CDS:1 n=1 Tax=Funneliformis mosseae TaxID=27381 RepID=A0A9N8VKX1_FUNMO|nr:14927_t:CDS:2 [Funneliformis mosseae]